MLESPKFVENNQYDGARTFTYLADLCGLSVDLVNFLLCQILALFLASLFRSILHPSKVTTAVRHTFALTVGLAFGYFCFGKQAIHIAGLPAICYIVIRTQDPRIVQRSVMLVAMSYLLCVHLMRQIYDYGSYALDITGPLMIITQKVTSLAFSIHDGFVRQDQDLTKAQQYHAVNKMPTALEYFSYVLHFQGLMAGPLVFYKDYIDFVEGYNLLKHPSTNGNMDNGKTQLVLEPSPTKVVVKKVISSLICAFIFMKFVKMYPVKTLKDGDFIEHTSLAYKFWYAMMATTCIRFKYYHAWLLADAICNNSGLGFTGYDKDGNAKWDLISNINVLSFEFATNMRDAINNWNCGTNRWLRTLVYERVPRKYGTLLTFTLSAVWHGFYPGYYLTFATGAVVVTAGRVARRLFRHRFQSTQFTRMFYDILTCLTTRIVMGYATFPFVLLEFMGSIRLYLKLYLCLHIISLIVIFVLPKFIRGEKRSKITPADNLNEACIENVSTAAAANSVAADIVRGSDAVNVADKRVNGVLNAIEDDLNNVDSDEDSLDKRQRTNSINLNSSQLQSKQKILESAKTVSSSPQTMNRIATGSSASVGTVAQSNIQPRPSQSTAPPSPSSAAEHQQLEQQQQQQKQMQRAAVPCAREAVSVKHDQCEMDQLSNKLKEKIEAETKNIEEFIDKTVTETVSGIVEFKKDLMRDIEFPTLNPEAGLRRRNVSNATTCHSATETEESAAFLKKEIDVINAVVQQANVLPAVLSNGHAK